MTGYVTPFEPTATITVAPPGAPVDPIPADEGRIVLDENYSPYGSAQVTFPLTDPALGERLDPRTPQRCTLTAGSSDPIFGTRTFDLYLRSRVVDHAAKTVTITATTDEMMLHDTKHLGASTDRTAKQHQGSLRAVVNWALAKVGAVLAPGTFDPDMTASWDQTNLILNARAAVNTAGWAASGNGTVVRAGTSVAPEGASVGNAIEVAITTAGRAVLRYEISDALQISGGRLYTYSCFMFQDSGSAKDGAITIRFENDAGATLQDVNFGQTLPHNSWTKFSVTGLAPVNASKFAVYAGVPSGMPAPGRVRATANVFAEGVENDRWYDGDRPDEPDRYVYDYSPAIGTPSTRVALNPLDPELYGWEPGQSLYDFLRPFLEAAGARLWCDEQRVWRLDIPRPNDFIGQIDAKATDATGPGNTTAGTDTIDLDADDWATGVVVKYTWRTANGDRKTKYDFAGTPGKVITIERDVAWPGKGAAAEILASMATRGRTQTVTTLQYGMDAMPGFTSFVTLPGTAQQEGRVRRVTFNLADGTTEFDTITGTETP